MLDIRADFPFLERRVNDKPIIYFDNAATTQKPKSVLDAILRVYSSGISNVHRAVNFLADEVTQSFELGRATVAQFIGAQSREIIWVNNATQGINVVCRAMGREKPLRVLTTTLEHHSNILPWMEIAEVGFIDWNANGKIDVGSLTDKLLEKPNLVTIGAASNFLGTIQNVREVIRICQSAGVPVLLDASQSIRHESFNVRELGCDYLVFSGHKMYGPGGIGVLYVRNDVLERMYPVFLGGSMVKEVHAQTYVLNDIPYRFEPGTPNIEGVIGLAEAVNYMTKIGIGAIKAHEEKIVNYAKERLSEIKGLNMYGPSLGEDCGPIISFHLQGLESTAVAKILGNRSNIVVRSGFHCAQPAHDTLGIGPTVRASFAIYNSREEIDCMVDTLKSITEYL